MTYTPERWALILVDVMSGSFVRCAGEFEGFNYPATWTADSSTVVLGAPFQPTILYVAQRSEGTLKAARFPRQIPMPLLDAELLGG